MPRKRSPQKPKQTNGQDDTATWNSNGLHRQVKPVQNITSDVTSYARLVILITLALGVIGFLFYPDIAGVFESKHNLRNDFVQTPESQDVSETVHVPEGGRRPKRAAVVGDEERETKNVNAINNDENGEDLMEDEEGNNDYNELDNKDKTNTSKMVDGHYSQEIEKKQDRERSGGDMNIDSIDVNTVQNKTLSNKVNRKDLPKRVSEKGRKQGPIILNSENNQIVLDPSQTERDSSSGSSDKREKTKEDKHINRPTTKKGKSKDTKVDKKESKDLPDEVKNFEPTFQKTFTPKKIYAGGRRIPPVELLRQKESNSSVKVFLFDEFLSEQECDGLMKAHDRHVEALHKPPILCFDSINTLRRHIKDAKKQIKVTPNDFTKGTKCVNASFSLELQTWLSSNWSYSTAFYPGESKFSKMAAYRIQEAMGLDPATGGKFQITSYPTGKAYKDHTDCTIGGQDKRDRVVSVLMYLNDVEDGGETTFPDLGIWVRPKKGRAIVWNNMSPDGVCEPHSKHKASVVRKGSKYILIRWYYYQSFFSLGQRPPPPSLPQRELDQPMVMCDEYNSGSCRWYDEWSYEPLLEYEKSKYALI